MYPWMYFVQYHLLNKDPFPVPPLSFFMIMRELRGAFGLLLEKLAGPPRLRYIQEWLDRAQLSS